MAEHLVPRALPARAPAVMLGRVTSLMGMAVLAALATQDPAEVPAEVPAPGPRPASAVETASPVAAPTSIETEAPPPTGPTPPEERVPQERAPQILAPSPRPTESSGAFVPVPAGAFVLVPAGPPPVVRPVPPDTTIRRWRRSAGTLAGIGGATLLGSFALQGLRQHWLRRCGSDRDCQLESYATEPSFGTYTVMLHAMTVAAAGGAGAMLGNAAATEDVAVHGRAVSRPGLLALGIIMTAAGTITYATAGMGLYLRQVNGDFSDPASMQLRRFLLVDSLVVGTSMGAAMTGYAVARSRHGKALAKLRVNAGPSAGGVGVGVSGAF